MMRWVSVVAAGIVAPALAGVALGQGSTSPTSPLEHTTVSAQLPSASSEPSGYLGIVFTAPLARVSRPDGITVRHFGYPVVESVEPGSPAASAGISAGDTILAYDSVDVLNHDIALTRLLRPGTIVMVRVRRNAVARDVAVRVAPRPASFVDAPPPAPGMEAPDVGLIMPYESGVLGVAGATVVRTNADLRAALQVPRGVLVLDVAPGSPASVAGLRAGDVIVDAGRAPIGDPVALIEAIEGTAGRTLSVTVARGAHTRRLVLHW